MATPRSPPEYGTCRLCGDAVPPGAEKCPICGQADPIRAGQSAVLKGRAKRRFDLIRWGRATVVVGVVAMLAVLMVQAVLTPAPVAANPFSQSMTVTIAPGHFVLLQGFITGADYIQGNYTVLDPVGANLTFLIYNSTEFPKFDSNLTAQAMQPALTASSTVLVYSALYTDTYSFVWENTYPGGTGLSLTVFIHTSYESNVVVG